MVPTPTIKSIISRKDALLPSNEAFGNAHNVLENNIMRIVLG